MKTLSDLLTLACSSSVMGSKLNGYGQESGDLWMHSLAVAGCARSIAKLKKPELADDAFSAGLIHDCGKLILDPYIDERRDLFDTGNGGVLLNQVDVIKDKLILKGVHIDEHRDQNEAQRM